MLLLFGRPAALTLTLFNLMLPLKGCEISLPTTGSAKSTISVQVPGAGFRVYAVSDSAVRAAQAVLPEAERGAVGADQVGADRIGGIVRQRHVGRDAGRGPAVR